MAGGAGMLAVHGRHPAVSLSHRAHAARNARFRPHRAIDAHFAHLQKLAAEGVVLMAGRTVDTGAGTWGIVVFTAPSLAEAGIVMRGDPAIAQGVMHCELFPYRVAVWSDRFRPAT